MPGTVAMAVAMSIGTATGSGIVAAIAYAAVYAATTMAISYAVSAVMGALSKKPKSSSSADLSVAASDRAITARQPVAPWRVVYGRARMGGTYTFLHTTGSDNEYFHIVITLAGHRVKSIGVMYFDGEAATDADGVPVSAYDGYVTVVKRLGHADQTAIAELISAAPDKWTADHKQSGRAHVYVRLKYSRDTFPNGLPNITFDIEGKDDIWDPRTDTTGYSENAALCVADYLSDPVIGLNAAADIDADSLIEAANICDEAVTLADSTTEPRYALNGAFETSEKPVDILAKMLTASCGMAVNSGGKWHVKVGAYRTPAVTLTESDLRGPVSIQSRISMKDNYNGVKGVFVSPDNAWQASDFPAYGSAAYLTEDGGERTWHDIDLGYTISAATAQRIAKIDLERTRRQMTVTLTCGLSAWRLTPGDTVMLTLARFGWTEKVFEVKETHFVVGTEENPTLNVSLILRETDANVYAWSAAEEQAFAAAPRTTLPSAFSVPAPADLILESGTAVLGVRKDGTVFSRIKASWTAPASAFVLSGGHIESEIKKTADSTWEPGPTVRGDQTALYVLDVIDGEGYDVRVRSVNVAGVPSAWATPASGSHTVIGKTAAPSTVAGLTVRQNGTSVILEGAAVADLDVAVQEFRFGAAGAAWEAMQFIEAPAARPGTPCSYTTGIVPPGTWRFAVKARDTSGNYSTAATYADATIVGVASAIETGVGEQAAAWLNLGAGSGDGFIRHWTGKLVADGTLPLSDYASWDDLPTFCPDPVAEAVYEMPAIDIDFDDAVRIYAGALDFAPLGGVSGSPDVKLQIYTWSDGDADPDSFADWLSGLVTARHIRARLRMVPGAAPGAVSGFRLVVDKDTVTESDTGFTVAPGGTAISIGPFHNMPLVQCLPQSGANVGWVTGVTKTSAVLHVGPSTSSDDGGAAGYTARGI